MERLFTSGMWLAAAVSVVAGFFLRLLTGFTHNPLTRIGGVGLIALGLLFAILAAGVESIINRRLHKLGSQGTKR